MTSNRVRRHRPTPVSAPALRALRQAVAVEGLEDRRLFAADLVLTEAAAQDTALTGGIVPYTLTLRNVGNLSAANVHVVDTIPDNTTFFSYSQQAGRPVAVALPRVGSKAPVDFNLGTVAPGEVTVVTVMVKVDAAAPDNGTFFNVATATTTSLEDPTPDDNKATSNATTIINQADLTIDAARTVDASNPSDPATPAGPVIAGTDITYTVTITNKGPSVAGNLLFTHAVSNFTTFVSLTRVDTGGPELTVTTPQRGYTGLIKATSPSFPANGSATFKIVEHVIASAPTTATDVVTAAFTATSAGVDRNRTDNVDVTVENSIIAQADISVSTNTNKLLNPYESNLVDYIVTIRNNGYSDAQNVGFTWTVEDSTPPDPPAAGHLGYYAESEQLTGQPVTLNTPEVGRSGEITASIDTLPAGLSASFRIRVLFQNFDVYTATIVGTTDTPEGTDQIENNTYEDDLEVTDAPFVITENTQLSAIVDRPLTRVFIMSFDDLKVDRTLGRFFFPGSQFTEHSGVIDWGDGTSNQVLFETRGGVPEGYQYQVFGSHTYTAGGLYRIKVTEVGDGGSRTFTASDIVVTGLRPLQTVANPAATATLNAFSNITLGTFTNPNGVPNSIYSGTAFFDDGTPASSGVVITPSASGVFTISVTHKFTTAGIHPTYVTVRANNDGGQDTTFLVNVNVIPPAVTPTGVDVTATAGVNTGNVAVATFIDTGDPNVTAPLDSYSATINWGDGTAATDGVLTRDDATGKFTVSGSHTYATAGQKTITTVISHVGGSPDATVTSKATVGVGNTGNTVTVSGQSVSGTANTALSGVTIATFTATNTSVGAGGYTAVINWGDGTAASAGTITQTAAGAFSVKGTHTYAAAGTFKPTITVTTVSSGGKSSGTATATIGAAGANTVASVSGKTLSATSGTALSGAVVASFVASNKTVGTAGYTAVINWGDGTATSAGTLVQTAAGAFNVKGTHTYTKTGTFKPTVTVKVLSTGKSTAGAATVTVAAPVVLKPTATSFTATLNKAFTGGVGTFTDSKGNTSTSAYKVLIDWGDGTAATTAKLVYNTSAKRFDVSGTHTYKAKSPTAGFKVKVSIQALSGASKGSTATINSTASVK